MLPATADRKIGHSLFTWAPGGTRRLRLPNPVGWAAGLPNGRGSNSAAPLMRIRQGRPAILRSIQKFNSP